MAAAQFAPIAANIGEQVGGDALELTAGVGASTHAQQTAAKKEEDARQSAMNSGDTCNQLEVEVPDVIELRRRAAGAPEYRELEIGDSLDQRQWLPLADSETTPDGWRPAVNFLQMNFSPPLGAVVPETASSLSGLHALESHHRRRRRSPHCDEHELRPTGRHLYLEGNLLPLRGDQHAAMLSASARASRTGCPRPFGLLNHFRVSPATSISRSRAHSVAPRALRTRAATSRAGG